MIAIAAGSILGNDTMTEAGRVVVDAAGRFMAGDNVAAGFVLITGLGALLLPEKKRGDDE